jgi:pyruvate dehydrogenase E2 component (dihydrolipoamide acetyltransferase)
MPTHRSDAVSDVGRFPRTSRIAISPRARRALREQGIHPRDVRGSGPAGRIIEADVLRAATTVEAATGGIVAASSGLTPMRRAIARVTTASCAVPQYHLRAELDATSMLAERERLLPKIQAEQGVRLSFTDLLLRAIGRALRDFPATNAIWRHQDVERLSEVNVGVAVNLDDGLLVPTLRQVDLLSLAELARRRKQLVTAARNGRLASEAASAVAISLSNLGDTRVDEFSALLFPPQSMILSAGRIATRPLVVDGQLCARPTLRLTLTVDHRVLDGAPAAQLLGRIVRYLEQLVD